MQEQNPFHFEEEGEQIKFAQIVQPKQSQKKQLKQQESDKIPQSIKISTNILKQSRQSNSSDNPFHISRGMNNDNFFNQYNLPNTTPSIFHSMVQDNNQHFPQRNLSLPKKLSRNQSQIDSLAYEQSIKKYKQILSDIYDENYWESLTKKNEYNSQFLQVPLRFSDMKNNNDKCFKATRLVFYKQIRNSKSRSYRKQEDNYIIRKVKDSIIVYQLKEPKINNIKLISVPIANEDISESLQYDTKYNRIYYFSNDTQQLVVMSTKFKEVICRVRIKYKRYNPILFIFYWKDIKYLLIVGGYQKFSPTDVEGSKFIEIFKIEKWEMSLNQVILKTNLGRIKPIVFSDDTGDDTGVYIIGGHSNLQIKHNKVITKSESDINYSTNKTGLKIQSTLIEQCFENENFAPSLFLINNINVCFSEPHKLFGGSVLFRHVLKRQKFQLFLPNQQEIYELKMINYDLHINATELYIQNCSKNPLNCIANYHRDEKNQYYLYLIDEHGLMKAQQQKWDQNKKNMNKKDSSWSFTKQNYKKQNRKCSVM